MGVDVSSYFLGLATPFMAAACAFLHTWLRETGERRRCDRHSWSTGPMETTPQWRMLARYYWHRLRRHCLPGQQPFGRSDQWLLDHRDAVLAYNRGPIGRRRALRALRLAERALAE